MKEEADKRAAAAQELADRALAPLSADVEDVPLDAAIARRKP